MSTPPTVIQPTASMTPADRAEAILDAVITHKGGLKRPGQVHMARSVAEYASEGMPLFIQGGTGIGKALDVDTLIPTPKGFVRMGDIRAGDYVFNEVGWPVRVLEAFAVMTNRPCFRVTFSDGSSLVADAEHLWDTVTRKARHANRAQGPWGGGATVTTRDILESLTTEQGRPNHLIPLAEPLRTRKASSLPITPYALGLWLAGTVGANDVATVPDDLPGLADLPEFAMEPGADGQVRMIPTSRTLKSLGEMGVLDGDAHIPDRYLFASIEQRRDLLAGLLDSSGFVSGPPSRDGKVGQVQFTDRRERLAMNVMTLAVSLGYRATVKGRESGESVITYVVAFTPGEQVFHSPTKAGRLGTKETGYGKDRSIISVEPVESRPVRCIAVDSPRHLYLAGTSLIPTHNSLAYLAGMLGARKVAVVAPHTKALQDQLRADLDLLAESLADSPLLGGEPLAYTVIKGRSSYLCLSKVLGDSEAQPEDAPLEGLSIPDRKSSGPTSGLGKEVMALSKWATTTETGDRGDLPFPATSKAWAQVSVSSDECAGKNCPFYKDNSCFAEQARRKAKKSHFIVVNQSYLATAMMIPHLLPDTVGAILVDEAHEFLSVVANTFGAQVTKNRLNNAAKKIEKPLRDAAGDRGDATFSAATRAIDALDKIVKPPRESDREMLARPAVKDALAAVRKQFGDANTLLGSLPQSDDAERTRKELLMRMLDNLVFDLDLLGMGTTDRQVAWVEPHPDRKSAVMRSAQFDVAETVFGRLIEPFRSVVFTSATLTIANSFDQTARNFGATLGPWRGEIVQSPFDYEKQGMVWLPDDMPEPSTQKDKAAAYTAAVCSVAERVARAAGGRTLVLCTSRASVTAISDHLRKTLGSEYPVLSQSPDTTAKEIAAQFAQDPKAVLVGTRTFWTGVSVEGDTCAAVVIDKTPFPSPGEPIFAARSEKADREDGRGSGFKSVSLAEATLTIVQGAGRLVRTVNDRGVIVLCDPRLNPDSQFSKFYGKMILQSLPPFPVVHDEGRALDFLREIDRTADDSHVTVEVDEDDNTDNTETKE